MRAFRVCVCVFTMRRRAATAAFRARSNITVGKISEEVKRCRANKGLA